MQYLELGKMLYSKDKRRAELIVTVMQLVVTDSDFSVYNSSILGISFADIVNILKKLTDADYLENTPTGYLITDSGSEYFKGLNRYLGRKGIYMYLSVNPDTIIKRQSPNKPYLPEKI